MAHKNTAIVWDSNPYYESLKRAQDMLNGLEAALGTPSDLNELISRELSTGPLSTVHARLKNALVDYLNQRFCAAILRNPEEEEFLLQLQKKIINGSK